MVKVIFYNLLRSKYKLKEIDVSSDTITNIILEIIKSHNEIDINDFNSAVVFYKGKPIHKYGFDTVIDDGEHIIITHFVGGG